MSAAQQLGLLSWSHPVVAPKASIQSREIARVEGRIAEVVLEFCRERMAGSPEFRTADLVAYVMARAGGAPDSASRILRALRLSGQVQVRLLSRSDSLYRVEGVQP